VGEAAFKGEVGRGIERFASRTPTLPPATHTNSYALGEEQILLVEPAPSEKGEQEAWLSWARGLRAQGAELLGVLLTHHHHDHVGAALLAVSELGLPLWGHPSTFERLPGLPVGRLLHGGEWLTLEGARPLTLEMLHTPGHAPGHLCVRIPEAEALIVGDMVASEGTILIEPGDGDMRAYLRSLESLEALRASWALPAHGAPIAAPSALFRRYIEHRLLREAKVREALGAVGRSLGELLPRVYVDTPPALWPLARLSLEAHLLKLETEGHALRDSDRWARADFGC
jgi:ribonuclease/clavin/mitogillin